MKPTRTVEQMCRDLLEIAVRDGLVLATSDPQSLTSGDLASMANRLDEFLSRTDSGD